MPLKYILSLCILAFLCCPASAQQDQPPAGAPAMPVLKKAVMCEKVKGGQPVDQSIIFDVSKATAYCWSEFDPVTVEGVVYFEWYRSGTRSYREQRAVRPPRWATYSSLKLRQADIGPWSVNITDETGNILTTLRFSITE